MRHIICLILAAAAILGARAADVERTRWYDNCMQYTPAAAMLGMKACGAESVHGWGHMLSAGAFSTAITCSTVQLLKHTIHEERPDGTDHYSFPSGHTAVAFMGATMLCIEYGRRYPWVAAAGYGAAVATGVVRVARNKHHTGDVIAGAGIGVGGTLLGYLLADLLYRPVDTGSGTTLSYGLGCEATPAGIPAIGATLRLQF